MEAASASLVDACDRAFYDDGIAQAYAAFSVVAFLARVLGAAARFALASVARLSAQRLFVAAMIRFMPSSLIRRFGGSDPAVDIAWDRPWMAAHLLFWASAIRRREAAEILRFGLEEA